MKKTTLLKAFGLLSLLFVFAACNKYEEGSNFSLISAKGRLANTWTASSSSYEENGNSTTNTGFTEVSVTFTKEGSYTYSGKIAGFPFTETGTWAFNSDKTAVIMTESGNGDVETWSIIKLKNKELKMSTSWNNGTLTFEFTGA